MQTLRKASMLVVEDLFSEPSEKNIEKSKKVVGSFVYLLMKDPTAYLELANLSSHDPYTLQHSMGVAINSIILARKLGIRDEGELNEIGMGGLLHDIGKVKVDTAIINKEGPLNDEEWVQMRKHSGYGYDLIRDNSNLTERTKKSVLEHHENKDGSGYPFGTPWDSIELFSKVVGISDIYNALTTNRSYSKARSPFEGFRADEIQTRK